MDRTDLDDLVKKHQDLVYSIALSVLRDPHAAEDVSQEVFVKAMNKLDGIREPSKVKAWLASAARNRAIDHHRARRRREDLHQRAAVDVLTESTMSEADLDSVFADLRDDYRQILLLKYVHKMSYREIAAALDMSVGAVGEKLHRVRRVVLQHLKGTPDGV